MFKGIITPEMHYDDWARQYDSDVIGWGYNAPEKIMEKITRFLSDHSSAPRILDVGTGTGLLSEKCRAVRSDAHIAGLDISQRMLGLCAARGVADELHRVDVARDDFPFEDESFDVVAAAGLMENVENIQNAVSEMTRVTRPGGLIAFTYMPTTRHPAREQLAKKLRPGRTSEGRFVMGDLHLYRHNPDVIAAHARAAGAQSLLLDSFVGYRTYVVVTVRYDLYLGLKIKGLQ